MTRRTWGIGSDRHVQRSGHPAAAKATAPAAKALRSDVRAAQIEMTGVCWDVSAVELAAIQQVGVEKARHRFRGSLPELIWNAASLEGNTFTLPEVRTLLEGRTVDGHVLDEEQQVIALSEAYSLVDEPGGRDVRGLEGDF